MTPGRCKVCGAPCGNYLNTTPRRRCEKHRNNSGPGGGKFDRAIFALQPKRGVAHDQHELAEMIGCSRQYISAIEARALAKLKRRGGAALLAMLLSACSLQVSGATKACERVRAAVNARLATCKAGSFTLDCDAAVDVSGDVDACVAAIESADCPSVAATYYDRCNLFNGW